MRRNLSTVSSKGLYSYSTCTYDGDADNDSFETAECSMYSGFQIAYEGFDDETANGVTVSRLFSEDTLSAEGGKTFEKGTRGSTDDDDLSYISEVDYDDEHNRKFIFTKKKNLRLDIGIDSTQSVMSFDTLDITTNDGSLIESEKVPYLESITSGSALLEPITYGSPFQLGTTAMNGSMLSNENETSSTNLCARVDWFPTINNRGSSNRHKKFQSIPIKSTCFYEHQSGIFMK